MRQGIFFIICLFIWSFAHHAEAEEMVKVKLKKNIGDVRSIDLQLKGDYFSLLGPIPELKEGVTYHLTISKSQLRLTSGKKNQVTVPAPLVLIPTKYDLNHIITLNGDPYLGAMEFTYEGKDILRPINQLPLEDYLKGVVPFEVYPSWSIETLKAQTLAARTYAVSHGNQIMDDTIQFQVYNGYHWDERTNRAVNETKGEVITFKDHLIDAYYSASNGGITQSNKNVWGGKSKSFYPIKKDPFDPIDPWQVVFHRSQIDLNNFMFLDNDGWETIEERDKKITTSIKNYLIRQGYSNDLKIIDIPVFKIDSDRDDGKRVKRGSITIEFMQRFFGGLITFEKFELKDVPINKIRPMIGGDKFKSYLVDDLSDQSGLYVLKGRGYGHGVGMSQWGASLMGETGKSYKEILQFYFPGTEIQHVGEKESQDNGKGK